MASFSYDSLTDYYSSGPWYISLGGGAIAPASAVSDDQADNNFFTADDSLSNVNIGGDVPQPGWSYIGYTEIGGIQYPVVDRGDGRTTVFGIALDPNSYPTLASLNIQDDPLPVCFAAGTGIATPTGETPVEALQIGDPILTADGRTVPVKWIGRQTVMTLFRPAERLMPVRIAAGALGDGLPLRDLTLTADHALMVDGLLINAGALVNGTTITWVQVSELGDSYTVYHVETEEHDIILAEGTPAETFIDYAGRQIFDNYAEYVALYGEERMIAENPAPRISSARMLPQRIRDRLGLVAAA